MNRNASKGRSRGWPLAALGALGAGCIYISVNFPADAINDYAAKYVREVYGEAPAATPGTGADPAEGRESEGSSAPRDGGETGGLFGMFLGSPVYAAAPVPESAQEKKIDLDVSSPAILAIKAAEKERFAKLKPLYEKGLVGIAKDGTLAVREVAGVSLKERTEAGRLASAENSDRASLYREIAVVNDIPMSEVPRIQKIFAEKWIQEAPVGWWVQDEKGRWIQKQKTS